MPPARGEGATLRIDIITIFPEYFGPLEVSLIGKATQRGDIVFGIHDLRTWARDVHHTVDDAPFGGGPGMVMKPEPWGEALDAVVPPDHQARLVVPSPAGIPFTQALAAQYATQGHLVFACGRYEGIDARVVEYARSQMTVDEVSIGDYVLAGGELAVLVMTEAICRLLPGVIGNAESASDDSFGTGSGPMAGLVEGPAYTRPRVWRGREVPPVLLSGDHAAIARWRRDCALRRTAQNRPDLAARLVAGRAETADTGADGPAARLGGHPAELPAEYRAEHRAAGLDERDREVLYEAGFPFSGEDVAH
jgi:tRNA (guanine37-N1)-methyltransferase